MIISEIEIIPINAYRGHVGFCRFVLNKELAINNVAIHTKIDGSGIRLVYPLTQSGLQACYPITESLGNLITKEVEKEYFRLCGIKDVVDDGETYTN
ncbi:hypothetical protein ACFL56_00875 [Candidatus Margulisiibacteriota bacterium]